MSYATESLDYLLRINSFVKNVGANDETWCRKTSMGKGGHSTHDRCNLSRYFDEYIDEETRTPTDLSEVQGW